MRLYYGLGADHLFGDHPKVASKHARFDVVESGGRIRCRTHGSEERGLIRSVWRG